ncbi:hypothetical protein [Parasulfitobacter algicola]|uniref:Uncharacterized protein n=1 Tax=Parasulfitobacter algicola TaxID=2614809 RepID=A0ABX2J037_9RHOB|nr:hypothetical protein [Sulfitobacter algicola]NSX56368.1 hypothetical protein [Sulfitobacter algicola]
MSDTNQKSGSNSVLAFLVGALIVAVIGLAWFVYSGEQDDGLSITVEGVDGAAEAVEDAVTGN